MFQDRWLEQLACPVEYQNESLLKWEVLCLYLPHLGFVEAFASKVVETTKRITMIYLKIVFQIRPCPLFLISWQKEQCRLYHGLHKAKSCSSNQEG